MFPVPANNKVYAQVNGLSITSYQVVDAQGRVIAEKSGFELPVLELSANQFKSGMYMLAVGTAYGTVQQSFIIE